MTNNNVTVPLPNARHWTWLSRVLWDDHYKGMPRVTASTYCEHRSNLRPFIGKGDVSKWVKTSRVVRKTRTPPQYLHVIAPRDLISLQTSAPSAFDSYSSGISTTTFKSIMSIMIFFCIIYAGLLKIQAITSFLFLTITKFLHTWVYLVKHLTHT